MAYLHVSLPAQAISKWLISMVVGGLGLTGLVKFTVQRKRDWTATVVIK